MRLKPSKDKIVAVACLVTIGKDLFGKQSKDCLLKPSIHAALVQFEELISSKIEETKDIPEVISETGKIGMPHKGSCLFEIYNRHS